MKPVMQTVLGRDGNCFAACIASLFHLAIEEVPNFVGETVSDDWATPVRNWLRPRGYGFFTIGLNGDSSVLRELEGYVIVAGESERGLCHATIWKAGKLVHDPHPSQAGIREPQYVDVIYPLLPAAMVPAGVPACETCGGTGIAKLSGDFCTNCNGNGRRPGEGGTDGR